MSCPGTVVCCGEGAPAWVLLWGRSPFPFPRGIPSGEEFWLLCLTLGEKEGQEAGGWRRSEDLAVHRTRCAKAHVLSPSKVQGLVPGHCDDHGEPQQNEAGRKSTLIIYCGDLPCSLLWSYQVNPLGLRHLEGPFVPSCTVLVGGGVVSVPSL